jgi:hypothetical protein
MMTRATRRYVLAALGGGSLLVLGVREGLLLRDADDATGRARARQLGTVRMGAAAALLLCPSLLTGALGLGDSHTARLLPRLLAVRELALGVGATAASRGNADPWPWLMTIGAVDGAEALILMSALRNRTVDPAGGWAFVASDLGSASTILFRVAPRTRTPKSCSR